MDEKEQPYQVLVADDHDFVADTLSREFNNEDDFSVIGIAENGGKINDLLRHRNVDLLLLDLYMPGVESVQYLEKLCEEYPHPNLYVVVLTAEESATYAKQAIEYGARAYLSKKNSMASLKDMVRRVLINDEVIINVNGDEGEETMPLTRYELEVVRWLVKGQRF
ncbi:MAG: response regulator transcription factor [Saprospiraceae bacterium]|nr:response regulator transcription factor [Saprospiraceae bacterium]